jgi:uncharacterized protein (DUF3084 family)
MYTKEDFFRDYPDKGIPFLFPWEQEYHKKEIKKLEKIFQVERDKILKSERKKIEAERKKAEAERKKAEAERKKAEAERKKVEESEKELQSERLRADKLAAKLKELGINPD